MKNKNCTDCTRGLHTNGCQVHDTNAQARMIAIEQEGTDLYLKHNNAFAIAFDSLPDEVQTEYKTLYKETYGEDYKNSY